MVEKLHKARKIMFIVMGYLEFFVETCEQERYRRKNMD